MEVSIPAQDAAWFAEILTTEYYEPEERAYKWAVHIVLSAIFSEPNLHSDDLADLIADLFANPFPDMDRLGLTSDRQEFVLRATAEASGINNLRDAMANLCGGRWGLAQFPWISRAVEFNLGNEIAHAFRALVDSTTPVGERVDRFRDDMTAVQTELKARGGFRSNWSDRPIALSFVAMILAALDPEAYTFYMLRPLRHGYERYAQGATWPQGTRGTVYAEVCKFTGLVLDALRSAQVPVRDRIDAQSFLWLSYKRSVEERTAPSPAGSRSTTTTVDLDLIAKDLAQATYWPEHKASKLIEMTQRSGQLLFEGPPGTGKTFVAETLTRLLAGDQEGRVEVVQFHPAYAYEDFVEGIRPVVTEGSNLAYEVKPGIFLRLVSQAIELTDEHFFLVIDELNRANLPRVLGELLYALEYRGPEHSFRLPVSGADTYVPRNITVIGTMNSADRSITLADAAIRRRFRHVNFAPDPDVLKGWLYDHELGDMADLATGRLKTLNEQLIQLLDLDRLIGHTYLMREDLADVGLAAPWEEDIEPVLREHLFGQPTEIAKLRDIFLAGS